MKVHQIIKVYDTGTAYIDYTFSSLKKAQEQLAFIRKLDEQSGWHWTDKDRWGEPVKRYNSFGKSSFGWKVTPTSGDERNTVFYFIESHEVV